MFSVAVGLGIGEGRPEIHIVRIKSLSICRAFSYDLSPLIHNSL